MKVYYGGLSGRLWLCVNTEAIISRTLHAILAKLGRSFYVSCDVPFPLKDMNIVNPFRFQY